MRSNIPNGWERKRIRDLAEVVGGSTPDTRDPSNYGGSIPWITVKDLSQHNKRYIFRGERNVTENGLKAIGNRLIPRGSVLISSRAPIGYLAIAGTALTTNQGIRSIVFKPNCKCDSEFFYYLVKHNVKILENFASGSTFSEITGSTLEELEFIFPPYQEQLKIAEILGSLDDKIELNYEMNKTLEAIAQAIFKNWFVDFEPFKDQLVYSEELDKEIPEGWDIKRISEYFELVKGKKCKLLEKYSEGCIPYLLIETFEKGNIKYWTKEKQPFVEVLDIVLVADGERSGKVLRFKKGILGSTLLMLKQKRHSYDLRNYAFLLLKTIESELMSHRTGSAVPHLDKNYLDDIKMVVPEPLSIIEKFNKLVNPIFEKIILNQKEIDILSNIRDTLLPKLLSGEIRVKVDIEKEFPEETKKLEEIEEEKAKVQKSILEWVENDK